LRRRSTIILKQGSTIRSIGREGRGGNTNDKGIRKGGKIKGKRRGRAEFFFTQQSKHSFSFLPKEKEGRGYLESPQFGFYSLPVGLQFSRICPYGTT